MSPQARFLRFHSSREDLTEAELDHLVNCDGYDRIAFVAVGLSEEGEENAEIGVARCYRNAEDPTLAEVAFLVVDRWQGLGIGHRLLETLAAHCLEVGVTRWSALVLAENDGAFHLLEGVGRLVAKRWAGGAAEVEIDLA
jgi:GNAT superfamily N-acetyltransferase